MSTRVDRFILANCQAGVADVLARVLLAEVCELEETIVRGPDGDEQLDRGRALFIMREYHESIGKFYTRYVRKMQRRAA